MSFGIKDMLDRFLFVTIDVVGRGKFVVRPILDVARKKFCLRIKASVPIDAGKIKAMHRFQGPLEGSLSGVLNITGRNLRVWEWHSFDESNALPNVCMITV